ncbi:MAG: sigma 54-interacting transcriptional regulator [Ignavibacteriales bacterium]|nr:sigma 54-interacting transcriptional regulator [Ignavibacteriales bacterium]
MNRQNQHLAIPDGIIVIGNDFSIVVFNEAAERITGFKSDDVTEKPIEIILLKTLNDKNIFEEAFESKKTYSNLAVNITCKNGKVKNVLSSLTPVFKGKNIISLIFVFRDTNEMLAMAEELSQKTKEVLDQQNKLEAIFNSSIEGTFTIDNDWIITSFNNSAVKITGYKKDEAIGKKCWEIFKSSLCRNGCHLEKTMTTGKAIIGKELEIINKSGKIIPVRSNSTILLDNNNEKIGAVETFVDISEIKNLNEHLHDKFRFSNIIGKSKEMEKIFSLFESVSKTDSTVLLTGESGTGKELAARAIHLNSSRRNGPFIPINCSAFNENLIESELFGHEEGAFTGAVKKKNGRFELAQGGTLFLDEIGDISLSVQIKLLRVIETRMFERVGGNKSIPMDVRIIAATNANLQEKIKQGKFREDLFYRINIINIHLPPLREKLDDLPPLVDYFIKQFNSKFNKSINGITKRVYELFSKYPWYGNIRELENVLEHSFVLCQENYIDIEHIPEKILQFKKSNVKVEFKKPFHNAEYEIIIATLEKNNGNRKNTAEDLGVDVTTLWRKMKKFNII